MYYVYILQSKGDRSYYIGNTKDLRKRFAEHNAGKQKYSSGKRPFILLWYCAFSDKLPAYKFEKYLKSGSGSAFAKKRLTCS